MAWAFVGPRLLEKLRGARLHLFNQKEGDPEKRPRHLLTAPRYVSLYEGTFNTQHLPYRPKVLIHPLTESGWDHLLSLARSLSDRSLIQSRSSIGMWMCSREGEVLLVNDFTSSRGEGLQALDPEMRPWTIRLAR
jgi:hypothetical protein